MECKNCGTQLITEKSFCATCGAKVITKRLTLGNLWAEISEKLLNLDNTILKTFRDLFKKPEAVIDGFISGVRKKYLNPVNYVALTATYSGLVFYLLSKLRPDFYSKLNFQGQNQEAFSEFMNNLMDFQGFLYFLSIPLMAIISIVVFINIRKYNFTEQSVIYMYTAAQCAVLTSTVLLIAMPFYEVAPLWFNGLTYLIMIGFNAYVLKGLYNLSLKGILLKTLFFLVVAGAFYVIIVMFIAIIMVIYMIATGNVPEFFVPVKQLR